MDEGKDIRMALEAACHVPEIGGVLKLWVGTCEPACHDGQEAADDDRLAREAAIERDGLRITSDT